MEATDWRFLIRSHVGNRAFAVTDSILADCIGVGCGDSADPYRPGGFRHGKGFGYALLSYFASRALNIPRLPFCEDRHYSHCHIAANQKQDVLKQLDNDRVNQICNCVRDLYAHTQLVLREVGLKTVPLKRKLRISCDDYVSQIIKLNQSAKLLGISTVEIEMDVLNSFTDNDDYFGDIELSLDIPCEDVFYFCHVKVDGPKDNNLVEPGEWVVINTSPTGIQSIPVASIVVNTPIANHLRISSQAEAKTFMRRYSALVLRNGKA